MDIAFTIPVWVFYILGGFGVFVLGGIAGVVLLNIAIRRSAGWWRH